MKNARWVLPGFLRRTSRFDLGSGTRTRGEADALSKTVRTRRFEGDIVGDSGHVECCTVRVRGRQDLKLMRQGGCLAPRSAEQKLEAESYGDPNKMTRAAGGKAAEKVTLLIWRKRNANGRRQVEFW